jgi:hypothetical protein
VRLHGRVADVELAADLGVGEPACDEAVGVEAVDLVDRWYLPSWLEWLPRFDVSESEIPTGDEQVSMPAGASSLLDRGPELLGVLGRA